MKCLQPCLKIGFKIARRAVDATNRCWHYNLPSSARPSRMLLVLNLCWPLKTTYFVVYLHEPELLSQLSLILHASIRSFRVRHLAKACIIPAYFSPRESAHFLRPSKTSFLTNLLLANLGNTLRFIQFPHPVTSRRDSWQFATLRLMRMTLLVHRTTRTLSYFNPRVVLRNRTSPC